MERLSEKLREVIYENIGPLNSIEEEAIKRSLVRFAAYEGIEMEPEDIEHIVDRYGRGFTAKTAFMEELQAYRAIGTPDEFRAALHRTAEDDKAREEGRLVAKMVECPKGWQGTRYTHYYCPNCKKAVPSGESFCHKCGQALLFPKLAHDKVNNRIVLDFTRQEAEAALGGTK